MSAFEFFLQSAKLVRDLRAYERWCTISQKLVGRVAKRKSALLGAYAREWLR
jgi:hypothetical protein